VVAKAKGPDLKAGPRSFDPSSHFTADIEKKTTRRYWVPVDAFTLLIDKVGVPFSLGT
jgi:hypothetical protein